MSSMRALLIVCVASAASALRVPHLATRRAVLSASSFAALTVTLPAFAKPSELADPSLSNEERYAKAKARQEAEIIAALPINRLKAKKDALKGAESLIQNNQWTALRDLITETTGPALAKLQEENDWTEKDIRLATAKLRKEMFKVDTVAYKQQGFPGSEAFAGYCAEGVVPREKGGCKVKPAMDKAPLFASLSAAVVAFEEIIALAEK